MRRSSMPQLFIFEENGEKAFEAIEKNQCVEVVKQTQFLRAKMNIRGSNRGRTLSGGSRPCSKLVWEFKGQV